MPSLVKTGLDCTTEQQLAGQYTQIINPAIQQLNADGTAYTANEGHDFAAAKSALRAQMTLARALDKSLSRFPFPAFAAPQAKALTQAIAARVKLIAKQARSSSLARMRSFNSQIQSAAAAQSDLKLVHNALYTRPTPNQEP